MTCPICISVDNTSLITGMRAGALVLIVVGGLLIAAASLRVAAVAARAVRLQVGGHQDRTLT